MDNVESIDNIKIISESLNNSDRPTGKYNTPNLHQLINGLTSSIESGARTPKAKKGNQKYYPNDFEFKFYFRPHRLILWLYYFIQCSRSGFRCAAAQQGARQIQNLT